MEGGRREGGRWDTQGGGSREYKVQEVGNSDPLPPPPSQNQARPALKRKTMAGQILPISLQTAIKNYN